MAEQSARSSNEKSGHVDVADQHRHQDEKEKVDGGQEAVLSTTQTPGKVEGGEAEGGRGVEGGGSGVWGSGMYAVGDGVYAARGA